VFNIGTVSASAPIIATGGLDLLANPSACGGNGCTVTLTLVNSNGTPVPGVQLVGTCTGDSSIGLTSGPGVTDANGNTNVTITANLDDYGSSKSGSCTFTTGTGSPTATVNLQGQDKCNGASPAPPQCGTTATSTVAVTVVGGAAGAAVTFTPSGLSCSAAATATQTCPTPLPGGSYTITANVSGTWTGNCVPTGGSSPSLTATMTVPAAATTGLTCKFTAP
jgi:hypothetical protein